MDGMNKYAAKRAEHNLQHGAKQDMGAPQTHSEKAEILRREIAKLESKIAECQNEKVLAKYKQSLLDLQGTLNRMTTK